MRRIGIFTLAGIVLATLSIIEAAPQQVRTKFAVQAMSEDSIEKGAPAFILYPEGESEETLKESGADQNIEKAVEKLGYTIVSKESEAAVFVRVQYTTHEPSEVEVDLKTRPKLDYSNSASTRNYAATMKGGRYTSLANPSKNRATNNATSILGPDGKIIDLGEQENYETKIIEGEEAVLEATIYPLTFQVSAWEFTSETPKQLWAVQVNYNNLRDEEMQPQLRDISKAAAKFFGKNLRKEKYVSR